MTETYIGKTAVNSKSKRVRLVSIVELISFIEQSYIGPIPRSSNKFWQ